MSRARTSILPAHKFCSATAPRKHLEGKCSFQRFKTVVVTQSKTCSHIIFPSVTEATTPPASFSTSLSFILLYSSTALSSWQSNKILVKTTHWKVIMEDIFSRGLLNLEDPRLPSSSGITIHAIVRSHSQRGLPEIQSLYRQVSDYIMSSENLISSLANIRQCLPWFPHATVSQITLSRCWHSQRVTLTCTDLTLSCWWSDSCTRRLLMLPTNACQRMAIHMALLLGIWHLL